MKKLASSLLICSLLAAPCNASASDFDLNKILSDLKADESNNSTVAVNMTTADLEKIIKKAVSSSVDESVESSIEKAALKIAKDKKSMKNIAEEIEKTRKGSTLWKIVKFPFSATWNVVKSACILALALALPAGGTYLLLSDKDKTSLTNDFTKLFGTIKGTDLAKKIIEYSGNAVGKLNEIINTSNTSNTSVGWFWKKNK